MALLRFEDYIARPALISQLRSTFGSGRVYHAYIFAGPEGTGKRSMARTCAQALFCTDDEKNRPCGKCPGCSQFREGHPDVYELRVPDGKKQIPVDDVRTLIGSLSDRAFSGGRRVIFIDQADMLGIPGQNALLKTLEEPPQGTVFFLCVTSPNALLPTVVSRSQIVRFSPIDEDRLAQELAKRGMETKDAKWLSAYCEGSYGKALSCMNDESLMELSKSVQKAYAAAASGKGIAAASVCLKAEKDTAQEALGCFETIARGLLKKGDAKGAVLLEAVLEARRMLANNVTWQYALEKLFMAVA